MSKFIKNLRTRRNLDMTTPDTWHAVTKVQTEMYVRKETTNSSPTSAVHYPKVAQPKFDGEYFKWQQFRDIFKKMIYESTLPTLQKMWYLKTNVNGEAERLIRHLSLTEANYSTAWKTLEERFNNKRVLSNTLIQKILEHSMITNDSKTIKSLHGNVKETLFALNNIGIETDNPICHFTTSTLSSNKKA